MTLSDKKIGQALRVNEPEMRIAAASLLTENLLPRRFGRWSFASIRRRAKRRAKAALERSAIPEQTAPAAYEWLTD